MGEEVMQELKPQRDFPLLNTDLNPSLSVLIQLLCHTGYSRFYKPNCFLLETGGPHVVVSREQDGSFIWFQEKEHNRRSRSSSKFPLRENTLHGEGGVTWSESDKSS